MEVAEEMLLKGPEHVVERSHEDMFLMILMVMNLILDFKYPIELKQRIYTSIYGLLCIPAKNSRGF